jgi:3'-5' exoribonuclease
MSRQFVQKMADGDAVEEVYLVVEKQVRANRNGNIYLQLELHGPPGAISARLRNTPEPLVRFFESGDFLLVKGKVQLFQDALHMILSYIDRVETDFVANRTPHTAA